MKRSSLLATIAVLSLLLLVTGSCLAAKQKLVIVAGGVTPLRDQFFRQHLIPAFEERYNAEVELSPVGWNDLSDAVIVRYVGGAQVDLIAAGFRQPIDFLAAGAVQPMTRYLKQWGQMKDYPAPLWAPYTVNGEIYHVPSQVHVETVWWRKDLFALAGLPEDKGPQTWDEVVEFGRKLTRRDANGGFQQIGFGMPAWENLIPQVGGQVLTQAAPYDVGFRKSGLEVFEFLHRIVFEDQISMAKTGSFPGNVAMAMTHDEPMRTASTPNPPYNWEQLGQGIPLRRDYNSPPRTLLFVNSWFMGANSANPDLAWKFVEMSQEPEWLIKQVQIEPSDRPLRFSAVQQLARHLPPDRMPFIKGMIEAINYGHPYPEALIPEWLQARTIIGQQVNAVLAGEIPPRTAFEAAVDRIETILKQKR